MEIELLISLLSITIACLSFFFGRKDKSVKDTGEFQYKMGRIEEHLEIISDQIDKLSKKLDAYDNEIDRRIEKAIIAHEKAYHK